MKLLITGGSGLVGRYVVDELSKTHTVEVLDVKPLHRKDIPQYFEDVLDLPSLQRIIHGYDAVVHLAGIPHPLNVPAEQVFRVNTVGTFNVLEACSVAGIQRLVFMSSESTLGFAFSTTRLAPLYLPIDENHALRPQDPYGMSKVACELLCRGFSDRTGMTTICLRAPWIWVPGEKERQLYRQLVSEYQKWSKNLWAYIHVHDVARAINLSLPAKVGSKHNAFFISADENWARKDSVALAKEFFPETCTLDSEFVGASSFISWKKAGTELGFQPHYSRDDIFV